MKLTWKAYDASSASDLLKRTKCLYVFYHSKYGDVPYYIGKAKTFGKGEAARYNSGYRHLIHGMLDLGFIVYVADLGEEFARAECYEQQLISQWGTIRKQRIKAPRLPVETSKPWAAA